MTSEALEGRVQEIAWVSLGLESRPETLTLVRGMLGGVGEHLEIDPELLDDLKTAVSEACNNVVLHAYPDGAGPLDVELYARPDRIEVIVRDEGRGIDQQVVEDEKAPRVGLPVIRALTLSAEIRPRPSGGTEVVMVFAGRRDGQTLFQPPGESVTRDEGWSKQLQGDAVASVSPVTLLSTVLGRLARALAASARFSLDRFSDVYLVTDAISAHASTAASHGRVVFAIKAGGRRLELTVGPLRPGSVEELHGEGTRGGRRSSLSLLSDELKVESANGSELMTVVLIDHQRW